MLEFKSLAKEVKVKYETVGDVNNVKITSGASVSEYMRKIYPVDIGYREAFVCLFLNRANNTIAHSVIGIGGIAGTVADAKLIFQHGLLAHASAIILVHNHPSGNLNPSNADLDLTKKVAEFGKMIDMPILDHIILTEESYYSFADEGLI